MSVQYPENGSTTPDGGQEEAMTIQPDPADGTLVEREGVNAASDRSTTEGDAPVPSAESALAGGSTTGRPGDRPVDPPEAAGGPDTTPSQAWSGDTGGVTDPEATYG